VTYKVNWYSSFVRLKISAFIGAINEKEALAKLKVLLLKGVGLLIENRMLSTR